jgi:shikimate kinase
MLVFLIGFMGVGKTTTGRKLAKRLQLPFLDMDDAFAQYFGTSVASTLEEKGEQFFRQQEHELLKMLIATTKDAVISTGGGVPCHNNNMQVMNEAGITLYLSAPVGALMVRISQSRTSRPLVRDKKGEELRTFITHLLELRRPYYEQAQISADALSVSAEQLERVLRNYGTNF